MFKSVVGMAAVVAVAVGSHAMAADLPVKAPKPLPPPPPFFIVNQNSVSYSYVFNGTNPGAGTTPKHDLNFTHFDVWAYGTNFFTVDWLKATNSAAPPNGTPAAPCDRGPAFNPPGADPNRCAGYTEIYGLFRSTFGWNQLFNTKAFAVGPLTNIEFVVGADLNTDNTTLGSAKRSIQGGVQFDFAAPWNGFLNVGLFAYHEWQNDGFSALFGPNFSGKVEFDTTWAIEALYVQPLGFLPPERRQDDHRQVRRGLGVGRVSLVEEQVRPRPGRDRLRRHDGEHRDHRRDLRVLARSAALPCRS
jgi:hypothetical protein